MFDAFGPDPDMQLYGRGLRRRLPTMFDGDERRLRMAYSLMFSMPGAPTLFYGEEIGMGENLAIEGRLAVRTPMQWTSGPAAGFTTAPPDAACRPFPDGEFAPEHVNVAAQRTDPESLLNWFERLIRLRKSAPEIGWGDFEFLDTGENPVSRCGSAGAIAPPSRCTTSPSVRRRSRSRQASRPASCAIASARHLRSRFEGRATSRGEAHGYRWLGIEPAD